MKKRTIYIFLIFISIFSNCFAIQIKELYPLYSYQGDFSKFIVNDIYAYLSDQNQITVIDIIERKLKSTYKPHRNKKIFDIIVTKDKYLYILHKDGVETVDFLKAKTPYYIKCLCLPHYIDLNRYNLFKLYLLENKDTLYINYGEDTRNNFYLPIDISYRYEPIIKRNILKASSYDIISLNSYLLKITENGFEILAFTQPKTPVVIGSYQIGQTVSGTKVLKYENNIAYFQHANQIDIVDVSYPPSPLLLKMLSIDGKLLSVKDKELFVAKDSTLKIIDTKNLNP